MKASPFRIVALTYMTVLASLCACAIHEINLPWGPSFALGIPPGVALGLLGMYLGGLAEKGR